MAEIPQIQASEAQVDLEPTPEVVVVKENYKDELDDAKAQQTNEQDLRDEQDQIDENDGYYSEADEDEEFEEHDDYLQMNGMQQSFVHPTSVFTLHTIQTKRPGNQTVV